MTTCNTYYLLNNKRQEISLIEAKYNTKLNFNCDPTATSDSYSIEKIKLPRKGLGSNSSGKQAFLNIATNYKEDSNNKNKHFCNCVCKLCIYRCINRCNEVFIKIARNK
jgi:hypothetical protein